MNLFTKDFQNKLNNLLTKKNIKNLDKINDKVARDFIKYFFSKDIAVDPQVYEDLIYAIKLVALANDHEFVTQSDLVALIFLNQFPVNDFEKKFWNALDETMFRELNHYISLNGELKDLLTLDFEQKTVSDESKQKAGEISEWSSKKAEELILTKPQVLSGPQISNFLTINELVKFINNSIDEKVKILKWHALSFKIIQNS